MKAFILLALVLVPAVLAAYSDAEYQFLFESFQAQYQRNYAASERAKRFAIFKANVDRIEYENTLGHSYTLGVNQFADMTNEEFRSYLSLIPKHVNAPSVHQYKGDPLPSVVDWRSKAVTPVKNQGGCGSCWAFSTTGTMEGAWAIAKGKLVSLSEQQLVDCDKYDEGCKGGLMHTAMEYVIKNGGIDTEECYSYRGSGGACKYDPKCIGATFKSYVNVTTHDDKAMMSAVAQQPIAIALCANWRFQFYSGGVFDDASCSSKFDDLNHGVLIVGYGTEGGKDYYIVKNSWGQGWGIEHGYIRMAHGPSKNICGILDYALYPVVA